jgi:hypothetical protein
VNLNLEKKKGNGKNKIEKKRRGEIVPRLNLSVSAHLFRACDIPISEKEVKFLFLFSFMFCGIGVWSFRRHSSRKH